MRRRRWVFIVACVGLAVCIAVSGISLLVQAQQQPIKWVEFNIPQAAMEKALKADIDSQQEAVPLDWVELLSALGTTYWGEWSRYKAADMDKMIKRMQAGEKPEDICSGYEQYDYFRQTTRAVLGGLVGSFSIGQQADATGQPILEEKYGLRAYSPIAYGFSFSHYDDFGDSRSFGYRRRHLGNDLLASVGTPVVAVEGGVITHCGWNKYGGWRVGIRSFDGLRYYYYAHLRKGHPFAPGIAEGNMVSAGQPIGYVGMTGYSDTEDTNGMTTPHLHFGLQLIFDPSQEQGEKEIWVDVYALVNLLEHHKSALARAEGDKDYSRKYPFLDPTLPAETPSFPQAGGELGAPEDES